MWRWVGLVSEGNAQFRRNIIVPLWATDINECETKLGLSACGSDKECVNTPGGYDCVEKKSTKKVTTKWVMRMRSCNISVAFVWSVEPVSGHVFQLNRSLVSHWHAQKAISNKATNVSVSCCRSLCFIIIANEFSLINHFDFGVNRRDVSFQWRNWTDIDECATDRNACASNQNCINLPGSFECECKNGFNLDKALNACVGKVIHWKLRILIALRNVIKNKFNLQTSTNAR